MTLTASQLRDQTSQFWITTMNYFTIKLTSKYNLNYLTCKFNILASNVPHLVKGSTTQETLVTGMSSPVSLVRKLSSGPFNPLEILVNVSWACLLLYSNHYNPQCSGYNCVNPPPPPTASNLQLSWNSNNPPTHTDNGTVMYVCNAGTTFNRFESDFDSWNLTLTCLPNNQFTTTTWPKCADSK